MAVYFGCDAFTSHLCMIVLGSMLLGFIRLIVGRFPKRTVRQQHIDDVSTDDRGSLHGRGWGVDLQTDFSLRSRIAFSLDRSSLIHTDAALFPCCCASCPFTPAECWSKGHAGPPDERGGPCHWHADVKGQGGLLLPAHGQRVDGGGAAVR